MKAAVKILSFVLMATILLPASSCVVSRQGPPRAVVIKRAKPGKVMVIKPARPAKPMKAKRVKVVRGR